MAATDRLHTVRLVVAAIPVEVAIADSTAHVAVVGGDDLADPGVAAAHPPLEIERQADLVVVGQ